MFASLRAIVRRNAPHDVRSNPEVWSAGPGRLDCFVARAPRNDDLAIVILSPDLRMTDMRRGRLMRGENREHSVRKLRVRVAHCPPPPVARKLSHPSWKVIVSASHGQYHKPGSNEPGFFSWRATPDHDFVRNHSSSFAPAAAHWRPRLMVNPQ